MFSVDKESNMRRRKILQVEEISVGEAFERFVLEKKAHGLSDNTLETYRLHVEHFIRSVGAKTNTSQINEDKYNLEIIELRKDTKRNDVTVASYCRSIRAFIYWLQDSGYVELFKLDLPKYEKKVKEIYTSEEIEILLKKPLKGCSEVEYQTWVFINLVMATGLRVSSVLDMKVIDYLPKESIIYVQHTKQKIGQKIQINKELGYIIKKYIELFGLENEAFLFCIATGERMAKRTIQDNVATYNRKRGVKKTSIHLMRHTFAVNYYTRTKDIMALKRIMGHSQITTTEHYLQSLGVVVEVSEAYNPQVLFMNCKEIKKRRGKL